MQSTIPTSRPAPAHRPLPTWTPAAFRARALELMETHHLGWWACHPLASGHDRDARLTWVEVAVPSATLTTAAYRVRYTVATDTATCACIAAQRRQPCFHAGVATTYGRRAAFAAAPPVSPAR